MFNLKKLLRRSDPTPPQQDVVVSKDEGYHHHVVIDIETLGTDARAVVFSIGAAQIRFDHSSMMVDRFFYSRLPVTPQLQKPNPRLKDLKTLAWWDSIKEEEERRKLSHYPNSCVGSAQELALALSDTGSAESVLKSFADWLRFFPACRVWGNGPSFDNAIMKNLYSDYCMELPWRYSNERCVRSFGVIGRKLGVERPTPMIPHHALFDAVSEMQWLMDIHDAIPDKRFSLLD